MSYFLYALVKAQLDFSPMSKVQFLVDGFNYFFLENHCTIIVVHFEFKKCINYIIHFFTCCLRIIILILLLIFLHFCALFRHICFYITV